MYIVLKAINIYRSLYKYALNIKVKYLAQIFRDKQKISEYTKVNINRVTCPSGLFNTSTNMLEGSFIYVNEISAHDHIFGYKICKGIITDFYVSRAINTSFRSNTNKILQKHPGYHCVEYNPAGGEVNSKYKFLNDKEYKTPSDNVGYEMKYSAAGKELQLNNICTYEYVPDEYLSDHIDKNMICGYKDKGGVKLLIVKGPDFDWW